MPHISEAAPLQISRFYTGWYSFRNPLIVPIRQMGRRIIELYDAISDGLNMECSNRLTLFRRPGYTLVSPNAVPGTVLLFSTFKPSSFPGQTYQLIDTTTDVLHFQPNGLNYETKSLWLKETPALTNFATVGAYDYMANETFAEKWDSPAGPQQMTLWGIDMYDPQNGHLSGNQPASVANFFGGGGPAWTISGAGGSVTLQRPLGNVETLSSQWLQLTNWGVTWPTGGTTPPDNTPVRWEVAGFRVNLNVTSSTEQDISLSVRLMRNGTMYGGSRTVTLPANLPQGLVNLGRPQDLWDGAWTLNDFIQPGFGVAVQAINSSASTASYTVSFLPLEVFISQAPVVGLGAGTLTSQIGYAYKYCYGNSHSGHISSPTPPSFAPSGVNVFDGLIQPVNQSGQVTLIPSLDPQVTNIHVYRTTDGGGNPFFELPTSPYPNVDQTITDNAPDNELQIANICPDPHFNDPPPFGMVDPVWFAGRLWAHRHHQLFFASGPDISMGNGEEAWYPVYEFAVPTEIIRKFPTPNGMILMCVDDILIVRGISTFSFTVNDFAKDLGMRTWTAGDSDGTNIYFYSSDRQFLLLAPNGFTPISANIADQIEIVDPRKAYVAMFRYTAKDNMVFVADGSTFIYPYNQELQAWGVRQRPVQGVNAIGTVETMPGVFQFWRSRMAASGSMISRRDLNSWIDEDTPYPCFVIFGPIPVADFLTLAQMRDIVLTRSTTNSQVFVSVLANEIFPMAGSQFEILQVSSTEPPELSATPSLSYTSHRYTWKSAPLPEFINLYFKRIDFSADPNPDEIYVWTAGGTQTTGGSSLGPPGLLPQLQGR